MDAPRLIYKTKAPALDQEPEPASELHTVIDGFLDAGAEVIAEFRRTYKRELELMAAQSRETIATMRAEMLRDASGLRSEVAELRGALTALLSNSAVGDKVELSATKVIRKVTTRKS